MYAVLWLCRYSSLLLADRLHRFIACSSLLLCSGCSCCTDECCALQAAKRSLLPHPVPINMQQLCRSSQALDSAGAGPVAPSDACMAVGAETMRHAACADSTNLRADASSGSTSHEDLQRFAATVAAGGIAGCAMWGSVLPIDSAKTRIQAARPGGKYDVGLLRALKLAWVEGGVRSWWAGLGPTLLRAFPANAVQWLAWEASLQMLM